MCGRFSVLSHEEIVDVAEAVERQLAPKALSPNGARKHAFPGSTIALIAPGKTGKLDIVESTWGFNTAWSKQPVFNTRIESALNGSALWRDPIRDGRCIVPVATFFEPHATETVASPRTGKPMKRPYEFANSDGSPLLLAGLQAEGRCSIVTCEPNKWVAPIHNRMPLILSFHEVATWLDDESPHSKLSRLADRGEIRLIVHPEQLAAPQHAQQLSLFG